MSEPAVTISRRRLGDIARPAGGRTTTHHVLFSIVAAVEWQAQSHYLVQMLEQSAGSTRCGPAVVEPAFTHEAAAAALRSPAMAGVPVRRLNEILGLFALQAAPAVLLVGHCPVLWTQVASLVSSS